MGFQQALGNVSAFGRVIVTINNVNEFDLREFFRKDLLGRINPAVLIGCGGGRRQNGNFAAIGQIVRRQLDDCFTDQVGV